MLLDGVEMMINTHPSLPVCEAGIGAGQVKIMISKNVDNKHSEELTLHQGTGQLVMPEIVQNFCNKGGSTILNTKIFLINKNHHDIAVTVTSKGYLHNGNCFVKIYIEFGTLLDQFFF